MRNKKSVFLKVCFLIIHSRGVIANNLQNSLVEICFCTLCNTPVDVAKVYYLDSFAIVMYTLYFMHNTYLS